MASGKTVTDAKGVVWRQTQGGNWRDDKTGKLYSGKGTPGSSSGGAPAAAPAAPAPNTNAQLPGNFTSDTQTRTDMAPGWVPNPAQQAAINAVFGKDYGSKFTNAATLAASSLPLEQLSENLRPDQANALAIQKQAAEQGLSAPDMTAVRESGLADMNRGLETAKRQMLIGSAGAGRTGPAAMMDSGKIMNDYLAQRRELENQALLQNIAYKQQAGQNYWNSANTAANYQTDIAKQNNQYRNDWSKDVLGTGYAGAGWGASQDYQKQAMDIAKKAAAAGAAVSFPSMSYPTTGAWASTGNYSSGQGYTGG